MPVGDAVGAVLASMGLESAHLQGRLLEHWPRLVGEDLARHTRPGAIRNRELTVFARGSAWYAQLRLHGLPELQRRIVDFLGAERVARVVVQPDPEGLRASVAPSTRARRWERSGGRPTDGKERQ